MSVWVSECEGVGMKVSMSVSRDLSVGMGELQPDAPTAVNKLDTSRRA